MTDPVNGGPGAFRQIFRSFFNLLMAEWTKAVRNYKLTAFLIWSYPVGVATLFVLTGIGSLVSDTVAQTMNTSPGNWIDDMLGAWGMINNFPFNIFGRLLPLAFMAVVFAGEYEAGTWKNIVPRTSRTALVLAKILTPAMLTVLSLLLLAAVMVVGGIGAHRITGQPYGPPLSTESAAGWIRGMLREGGVALYSLLLLSTYAAVAALFTRTTLGALLLSFGLSLIDGMSIVGLLLLGRMLGRPELIGLYRFTPTYNLDNLRSWLAFGQSVVDAPPGFEAALSPGASAGWLALLLGAMVGLVIWLFNRQDITA